MSVLGCQPSDAPDDTSAADARLDLGTTTRLEFRLVDYRKDAFDVLESGEVPLDAELVLQRDGTPVLVFREVIVSGEHVREVTTEVVRGEPAVIVELNDEGANRMLETTEANLRRPMAAILTRGEGDVERATAVSVATIQGSFSDRFRITGLTASDAIELVAALNAGRSRQ